MPIADYKRQAILKWIQITLEMHLTENLNCIPEPQGVDSNKNNSFFFFNNSMLYVEHRNRQNDSPQLTISSLKENRTLCVTQFIQLLRR